MTPKDFKHFAPYFYIMSLKELVFFSFLFSSFLSVAQENKDKRITIGKVDSIYSNILKEKRKIWIYTPNKSTSAKLPVLYLFDGDGHFHSVTGLVQQLSQINGNTILPEMIVVGIVNTDRTRDLTPTHSTWTKSKDDNAVFNSSGGGAKFTDFLQKELIPFIEKKYSASPYRTLVGHSMGGLMTINILLDRPELFNAYIAIDPSLWWDHRVTLKKADQVLGKKKYNSTKLYLSIANTLRKGWDTAMARKDTSASTFHIRSNLEFADILKKAKPNGLNWNYVYYKDDSHTSAPLISEYDGLRFIFDFYRHPEFADMTDPMHPLNLDSLFTAHYANISKNFGYKVIPEQSRISQLGYIFLENDLIPHAFSCFNMNIRNYPKNYNVFNNMGDYYRALNDTTKAIEFYRKSIILHESDYSKGQLKKLSKITRNNP
jgi:predicted alpha/beta superfamily hydrolase